MTRLNPEYGLFVSQSSSRQLVMTSSSGFGKRALELMAGVQVACDGVGDV